MAPGRLIVVVRGPEAFSFHYPSVSAENIFGPYGGNLSNPGEKLELSMPGDLDISGSQQYIRVDRVNYSDGARAENIPGLADPWPADADRAGQSLTRKLLTDYGNDSHNWVALTAFTCSVRRGTC